MELEDQVAVVTGAGRGIGRACAETLAAAGARVIAVARTDADLSALEKHSSGRITGWAADVRDGAFYERIESLDRLDILVNNAGTNRPGPFLEVSEESLDVMLDLNVRAAFLAAQAAARVMLRVGNGGCIINMSSQMGHVGSPDRSVYCMTKHAVEGLTKALAVELASQRVRVNAVAPTFVRTPLTEPMLADPAFARFVLDMIPLGEVATVEDVAAAVLFLASNGARMVTGHSLVVDGGWTAR
jgi:NAD(P)-dependent dehydrogenase (short-subunit alcohol dehydrogenase family)